MESVLHYVAKRAPFTLPPEVSKRIVDDSGGNLRKAILVLEALKMQSYVQICVVIAPLTYHLHRPDLTGPLTIAKPDWETYCYKVADLIVSEQSPARVMEVRGKFYELLSHCIPATVILKVRHSSTRSVEC
jgi:replication factor C subunit 3/5